MQNNSNLKKINADIVIAGTGVAGMYAALSLPEDKNIIMLTKSTAEESDSFLAQGGICMLKTIMTTTATMKTLCVQAIMKTILRL